MSASYFPNSTSKLWERFSGCMPASLSQQFVQICTRRCVSCLSLVLSHFNEKCRSLLSKGLKDSNSRMRKNRSDIFLVSDNAVVNNGMLCPFSARSNRAETMDRKERLWNPAQQWVGLSRALHSRNNGKVH